MIHALLYCHHAERSDELVGALADVLAEPLEDPFVSEMVAVHSRGIERWLAQELSTHLGSVPHEDGIAGNIDFPFPGRLVADVLAAITGIAADDDPWRPRRLVWSLLDVLAEHAGDPALAALHTHLGTGPGEAGVAGHRTDADTGRRFGVLRHVADLFDRYATHRPEMVLAWCEGRDVDGSGNPVGDGFGWQPHLWRRVRGHLGVVSPVERLARLEDLRAHPSLCGLPPRLAMFGLTALPATYVEVLAAVAEHRDVHLLLLQPSSIMWEQIAGLRVGTGHGYTRTTDPSRALVRHPLLASWGRDARELQLVVTGAEPTVSGFPAPPAPPTLLGVLQQDIRANRRPPGESKFGSEDRVVVGEDDRSIQVHACHGRTRQVEVLRDAVLHALAEQPDLEPRDILIMCPDIEVFAPIIHAVFEAGTGAASTGAAGAGQGATAGPAAPELRVRLADRALRQTNPLLGVVSEMLDLVDDRVTALQVLDLVGREPVSLRFGFSERDRERLAGWVTRSGVRWGLDEEHRANYGLGHVAANTWQSGLDRVALGIAVRDESDRMFGGVVPYDDVEGDAVELAGRFTEMIARLRAVRSGLVHPRPMHMWRDGLRAAVAALTFTPEEQRWQQIEFGRVLDELVNDSARVPSGGQAGTGGPLAADGIHPDGLGPDEPSPSSIPLSLAELRTVLGDRLQGRPRRANHRTGDLTVCTLVPMRSVPHKVIGLLGMDDGAFPRRTRGDGDDLLERAPRVGDRDVRTEDRQLLLDALLAAERQVIVTYTGRDERTNEKRPPCVPVGELLDVLDRSARRLDARPISAQVVREHPLQPFDPRNFTVSGDGGTATVNPWSFDNASLAGAQALAAAHRDERPFLDRPLPALPLDVVSVDALRRFVMNPVQAFVRTRLGVWLEDVSDASIEDIPVELNGLERWQLAESLLRVRRFGGDVDDWARAQRARGVLPPGALADPALDMVADDVEEILAHGASLADVHAQPCRLEIGARVGEVLLEGTVEGLVGDDLVTLTHGRLKPKRRLAAWMDLLAATVSAPQRPLRAVTIGRSPQGKGVSAYVIPPLGANAATRAASAHGYLEQLLDLYARGMREPLPLYCTTSHAWASRMHSEGDRSAAESHAHREWERDRFAPEMRHPDHRLVHARERPFATVLDELARTDECADGWEGWDDAEQSRFARYAARLWKPLLDREQVVDPSPDASPGPPPEVSPGPPPGAPQHEETPRREHGS